jgi:hypothetical protein
VLVGLLNPLGANHVEEAIRLAKTHQPPPEALRYEKPAIRLLVAVCYHLQALAGNVNFFLSVRDAARIGNIKSLTIASAWLNGFVRDGILVQIEKGIPGQRRATCFRYTSLIGNKSPKPLPKLK